MNLGQPSGASHPNQGLAAGDTLDRYELLCPLAQGGMAAVWLARLRGKHGFQKFVAIKMIRPEHASDQRFQAMFLDEARIAAAITHPNVAQITDLGEENGVLYIAMEWIDGDSLSKLLRVVQRAGHRLPLGVALRILADTCGGLHAAHEQRGEDGQLLNVVHRDVSPTNVLLSNKGAPKVIDFGIAKAMGRLAEETSAGVLKGKISYMSPEQALGRGSVDRRADVWAIGSVLHMALAGSPPFRAENEVLALHRLTSGKPPDPLPPDVPPAVRTIVARAMAFNVDQRTPDCATLQAELESAMVACGCMTTPADVASFTGHYLADSARTRQEMVQRAIAAASDRERGGRPSMNSGTPSGIGPILPRNEASAGGSSAASISAPGHGSMSGSGGGGSGGSYGTRPSLAGLQPANVAKSFEHWGQPQAAPKTSTSDKWIIVAAIVVTLLFLMVVGGTVYTFVKWKTAPAHPATTTLAAPVQAAPGPAGGAQAKAPSGTPQ